jgi:hypothetical protein
MTLIIIAAVVLAIYAVGHANGRQKGQEDNVARIVTDFLTKRR